MSVYLLLNSEESMNININSACLSQNSNAKCSGHPINRD